MDFTLLHSQDDEGNEGIAVAKNPGEKLLRIGKKMASTLVRQKQHDSKDEAKEEQEKGAKALKVKGVDQARFLELSHTHTPLATFVSTQNVLTIARLYK